MSLTQPRFLKGLEGVGKMALAALVALLCWRRARPIPPVKGARILLVRIDNRVGEVLLTTPLVEALQRAGAEVSALVHPKMVRVLEGLPGLAGLFATDSVVARWLGPFAPRLRAVRRQRFDVILNCSNWEAPAATSAVLARLAGPQSCVIGPAQRPSRWLADVAVEALPQEPSEVLQRLHLASPLTPHSRVRMAFRTPRTDDALEVFVASCGRYVLVNPGSRLAERRAAASAFARVCTMVVESGLTPVVSWGPGEEPLRDELCRRCPQAKAAPPTTLDGLARLMQRALAVICNNTGPMHLSVAVGAPTLAFFTAIDMARWGHHQSPHLMVDLGQTNDIEGTMTDATRHFLNAHMKGTSPT
jgi:heptosyltransferase III